MQENNIHSTYPNTVVVYRGKQVVFVAMPVGATWAEARLTYASLANLDPAMVRLCPLPAPFEKYSTPYRDNSVIDWSDGNVISAATSSVNADGSTGPVEYFYNPKEKLPIEEGVIPQPMSNLMVSQQPTAGPCP
ncbi:hypothetical protein ERJ75_000733500 [Trypanosoma vivax]|uniref:Uncharacterized protein n=1 Tax=Trypanosoma vivax (strain Y486) TaxID=1055687 RepID=G0TX97_TRYVY|nr:hypothetical protein TRVL_06887 [Trypanosoma vivax]KAH8613594.1 hypothetical protein ERJ75_000733500 [Trypanosoma vivax]CCC48587.1 conserved hypothetical protein [Trypanosoma vivax Y486]